MTRKEYLKQWRQTPKAKESNRAKSARYRREHPEKMQAIERRRYLRRKSAVLRQNELRRLRKHAAVGSHTEEEWLELCRIVGQMCCYCYVVGDALTKDHCIPLTKGGTDYIDNIVPVCRSCNSSKGSKAFWEWFPDKIRAIL